MSEALIKRYLSRIPSPEEKKKAYKVNLQCAGGRHGVENKSSTLYKHLAVARHCIPSLKHLNKIHLFVGELEGAEK